MRQRARLINGLLEHPLDLHDRGGGVFGKLSPDDGGLEPRCGKELLESVMKPLRQPLSLAHFCIRQRQGKVAKLVGAILGVAGSFGDTPLQRLVTSMYRRINQHGHATDDLSRCVVQR